MSAGKVAPQFAIGLFPFTERFGGRRQACGQTKGMKQPVRRKSLQIFPVGLGRRTEGARLQPHILHGKRTRLRRDHFVAHRYRERAHGTLDLVLKGEC